MSINFDTLPQDNPFALPTPGLYRATITEAKMVKGKTDPNKPPYLNLKLTLYDKNNKNCGSIYDIISESDSSVVQYKTGRFLRACGIPLTGSMELPDIAKIVPGKELVVDVNHSKPKANEDKDNFTPKAQIDVFSHEAYYLKNEFDEVYALLHPEDQEQADFLADNEAVGDDAERPFDAPDGNASAGQPSTTEY